ncbi:MAG TPA: hypothetical protein VLD84_08360 [Nitrososphaeraceae archaeon]|nr:hypothetical protein [Nitrososphaeraceae archaeon]
MKTESQNEEITGPEGKITTVCGPCVYGRHDECDKMITCICASSNHSL